MTDYPLTRRLLAGLGNLSAADELLPLPVLLNLMRWQLRAPLTGAIRLCAGLPIDPHLSSILGERYPQVRASKLFDASKTVEKAMTAYYDALTAHGSVGFDDTRVEEIANCIGLASNHYAAFILYLLGYNIESRPQGLELMEALLQTHPAVAEVLLELAEDIELGIGARA